ncbi:hypothetical protein CYMTET_28375 [Cymbomonas tetramitiformis]|uniref:Uncharacterized protein n=1 Tax=Cymbomonas tetramitiformis TaxID=36881 RepID=A0AAE0KW88_9CHLO|nr:hypothetical protein CYMTET_28375 [Cymbomonas tetramitiformis]
MAQRIVTNCREAEWRGNVYSSAWWHVENERMQKEGIERLCSKENAIILNKLQEREQLLTRTVTRMEAMEVETIADKGKLRELELKIALSDKDQEQAMWKIGSLEGQVAELLEKRNNAELKHAAEVLARQDAEARAQKSEAQAVSLLLRIEEMEKQLGIVKSQRATLEQTLQEKVQDDDRRRDFVRKKIDNYTKNFYTIYDQDNALTIEDLSSRDDE